MLLDIMIQEVEENEINYAELKDEDRKKLGVSEKAPSLGQKPLDWITRHAISEKVACDITLCFTSSSQGGHQPGKPGKVREFESGQGKVRENVFLPLVCQL